MFKAMLIKEFILVMRDRHALAALFIMPSIFILIMSMALKDTFGGDRALVCYGLIDQDQTAISLEIGNALRKNKALQEYKEPIRDNAQLQQAMNDELHFALTIPKGFGAQIGDAPPSRHLHLDVASDIRQEVLAQFQGELTTILLRLRLEAMLQEFEPFLPSLGDNAEKELFDSADMIELHFNGMAGDQIPTSTQQSVPSWIVFGMFFIIIPMSTIFINERKQNTLMRMQAMNISTPALFAGKIIPYMVINQIQVCLMVAVGMFIVPLLGADPLTPGRSLSGLFMVSIGLSLAAIGTSVLIAVSADTIEQATTIGGLTNILLGAIGGVMVPKFFMPPVMQSLANFSPMSWGLEGFLDIFLRGLGVKEVLPESLALAGFGMGLLLIAWLLFGYKTKRGV